MVNNEDENIEDLEQENTQSMEIMEINSADEDDCGRVVTVKQEYLDDVLHFFLLLITLLDSLFN